MISVENVSKAFDRKRILNQVSLVLQPREFTVLTGLSGSGKSTLLRIIAGLESPDSGQVTIDNKIASAQDWIVPPNERNLGFVFQTPALWPHMTVARNIEFAIAKGRKRDRKARVREILDKVRITDLANRYPSQISGGQARRVSLARALAGKPRIILMDEPLVNLDPVGKREMLELINTMLRQEGIGLFYVTHDRDEVEMLGGHHLELVEGVIANATGMPGADADIRQIPVGAMSVDNIAAGRP